MTEKQTKSAPAKLDETQLDDAVGGIIAIQPAEVQPPDHKVLIGAAGIRAPRTP